MFALHILIPFCITQYEEATRNVWKEHFQRLETEMTVLNSEHL